MRTKIRSLSPQIGTGPAQPARFALPVRIPSLRAVVLSLPLMLAALHPAAADEVALRAGLMDQSARLVFDWTDSVVFSSSQSGSRITLKFSRQVSANLDSLPTRLKGWVRSARPVDGGKSVVLTLARPAVMSAAQVGNRVVIDLAPPPVVAKKAEAPKAAPTKTEPSKTDAAKAVAVKPTQVETAQPETPTAKPTEAGTDVKKTTAPPSPPAIKPEAKAEIKSEAKPNAKPDTKTDIKADVKAAAQPVAQEPVKQPPIKAAPAVAEALSDADKAPAAAALPTATTSTPPQALPAAPSAGAVLPIAPVTAFQIAGGAKVPVALFQRGSSYFLVLPLSAPADLSGLVGPAYAATGHAALVTAQGGRVVRLTPDPVWPEPALTYQDGQGWTLTFQSSALPRPTPDRSLAVQVQPDYALGARLLIPAKDMGPAVIFTDPAVGDLLVAVPMSKLGQALRAPSRFAQVDLLPSWQGVVVKPKADSVTVNTGALGVEISGAGGLQLGDAFIKEGQAQPQPIPTGAFDPKTGALPDLPPLLNLGKWGQASGARFTPQKQELQLEISAAPQPKRNPIRLKLAHLYFANGLATEAASVWQTISQSDENIAGEPEYALMRAVAALSEGDTDRATQALADIKLPNSDSSLWQGMLEVQKRNWPEAARLFKPGLKRVWDYPEPYRSRLALGVIETALNVGSKPMAQQFLDFMKKGDPPAPEINRPALDYLSGIMAYQNGDKGGARSYLNLAAESWNQLWRLRANLALLDLDLEEKRITQTEAANRLERMRFAWRGDALEYDVLERLAQNHADMRDYPHALEEYTLLKERFPKDARAETIPATQQKLFDSVFTGPDRDKLMPYSQLAVWDNYPQFRPTDPAQLKATRFYLVDRMMQLDLVQQARDMLGTIIKDSTDPVERATIGLRQAGITLIDHKPTEALTALEASAPPPEVSLPAAIATERRLLAAKAQAEMGQLEQALAAMADDYGEAASRLRVDITWKARRWPEAAAALSTLTTPKNLKDKIAVLEGEQPDLVLRQATALALAGDRAGLVTVRDRFGPAMAKTPQATAFNLLTRPEDSGGLPDRAALQGRISEVDLFQSFLGKYRTTGSSPNLAKN